MRQLHTQVRWVSTAVFYCALIQCEIMESFTIIMFAMWCVHFGYDLYE